MSYKNGVTGVLNEDLRAAAIEALQLDPQQCRAYALEHTWETATQQFLTNLAPHRRARTACCADSLATGD